MKKKEAFIAALDIGSSKVSCLISDMPEQKGALNILGYGVGYHDCFKKGVVSDIKGLSDAVSAAVCEAEDISGKKVQSVFLSVSGTHLKGFLSHGEVVISDKDNEITRHDVDRVIASAKSVHMPYERGIIYSSRGDFIVDSEPGVANPVGMFGMKLETNMFLVTAKISVIDNIEKAVKYSGLGIEDTVISSLAGLKAVVPDHEKSLGVAFVDIGSDMTDILVVSQSRPVFLKALAIGGRDITKRLASELCVPEVEAERFKIERFSLDSSGGELIIPAGIMPKKLSQKPDLRGILAEEYTRIFKEIKKELKGSGCLGNIPSGVVMCGQSVTMDGCIELAESVLGIPVRIGRIIGLGALPKPLPCHVYFVAAGLLQLGAETRQSKLSLLKLGPKNWLLALSEYAKGLYNDYF
ncbi:MAG: cell division protein FtsA [Candidatus Omnitrophica bacterium]|nr:cell division protein FtsA [Candidatus Omnitrophota bacterium]